MPRLIPITTEMMAAAWAVAPMTKNLSEHDITSIYRAMVQASRAQQGTVASHIAPRGPEMRLWLSSCCRIDPEVGASQTESLFESWRIWAKERRAELGSMRVFSMRLQSFGLARVRDRHGRSLFAGISINSAPSRR